MTQAAKVSESVVVKPLPETRKGGEFYALVEAFRRHRAERSLRLKGYVSENTTSCYQRNLAGLEAYLRSRQLPTDPSQIALPIRA